MAAQQPSFFEPTAEEAIAAAHSLYDDELKPFGRILLKRIRERAAAAPTEGSAARFADADSVPLIDPKFLRRLCEECPSFAVEPAEGREYAVTLLDRPAVFVDATSHVDPYPMHMWVEASAYFESLEGEEGRLPCGRYACAQVLRERDVAFLRGRSLGELCHIIQLAISQRKLLGYLEGHTVPYCHSEECAKQRCAIRQLPFGGEAQAAQPAEPFASWEDMRAGLRLILEASHNPAPGVITLSNVKRLFRSQLGLEVSETVLGHSRVCELLQDPRLHDICSVQVFACGQALVSLVEQPQLPTCSASACPLWTAALAAAAPPAAPAAMSPSCSSSSSCASTRSVGLCAATGAPLATVPLPLSVWAAAVQAPLVEGKHAPHWDATSKSSYAESETDAGWTSGASDDLETCSSSSPHDCGELADCEEEALPAAFAFAGFVVRNTFIDESPRASAGKRSRSLPRSLRVQ